MADKKKLKDRYFPGWRYITACGACEERDEACQVRFAYNLGFLIGGVIVGLSMLLVYFLIHLFI